MNLLKITSEIMKIYNRPNQYNNPYNQGYPNYTNVDYNNKSYYSQINNYYKEKVKGFLYKQI
ncbi:MAG: hypothetical protein WC006_06170 [Bacilli bacterium]|nr:hypothetical protein [Bacilli bacterium]